MPVIGDPVTVRYGKADKQLYVFAASREMPLVHHWSVAQGRYFTDVEDRDPGSAGGDRAQGAPAFFPEVANPWVGN
jgi:macrolide transport system ATP-binding/permease protein